MTIIIVKKDLDMKPRTYSKMTRVAVQLLGQRIRLGRKNKQWSEQLLAERAGVSRATVQKIEKGELGSAIGLAFELAVLTDVPLFDPEPSRLKSHLAHGDELLALLPKSTHPKKRVVHDDF
jgi:transcriptional regulator with XRE-family HTH domain